MNPIEFGKGRVNKSFGVRQVDEEQHGCTKIFCFNHVPPQLEFKNCLRCVAKTWAKPLATLDFRIIVTFLNSLEFFSVEN